jgi:hypothetical protein
MPGTHNELIERTGMGKSTVKRWTVLLRACGWVHVPKWVRSDGPGRIQPVFRAGPGVNVPCDLPVLTPQERVERHRKRAKLSGEHQHKLARERAQKKAARVRKRGRPATPWDALMM